MKIDTNDVKTWLRYIHEYLIVRNDGRTSQIREILYSDQKVIEVYRNPSKFIEFYNDAYPNIKTLEEFIREHRINKIFE